MSETDDNGAADGASSLPSPFIRLIPARELPGRAEKTIEAAATPEERAAIAADYDLAALDAFETTVVFHRGPGDLWRMEGRLRARLAQTCVVTLTPVRAVLDEAFQRDYLPAAPAPHGATPDKTGAAEVDVGLDEDDPPEPLGEAVDIGAAALESLALALDPYPRAEGATFASLSAAPPGETPLSDEDVKPFAGLAALKKSMEGGD